MKDESIGVWGSFAKEWDRYVDGINHMGVRLFDKVNETVWIGGELMGILLQKFPMKISLIFLLKL